jgi:hypothetical protein
MTKPLCGSTGSPIRQTPVPEDPCGDCSRTLRTWCRETKNAAQRQHCAEIRNAEEGDESDPAYAEAVADFAERCHGQLTKGGGT